MGYISKRLRARCRTDLEPPNRDLICIEVCLPDRKCLITNCYRVQNYDIINCCADIEVLIEKAAPVFNDIFILGDLNEY